MMRSWQCCLAALCICSVASMPTIPGSVSSFVVRPALSPLAVPATDLRQQSSKSPAVESKTVTAKASGDIIIEIPTKSTAVADAVQAAVPFNEQHAGPVEHVEHSKPGFVSPTKIYSSLSNQMTGDVEVTARSEYSSHMSRAADNYGVWTYNIAITNHGDKPIRLLHRQWDITTLGPDKQQSTAAPDGFGILGMFVECCAVLDHSQAVRRSDVIFSLYALFRTRNTAMIVWKCCLQFRRRCCFTKQHCFSALLIKYICSLYLLMAILRIFVYTIIYYNR
jgi:ApaG domain